MRNIILVFILVVFGVMVLGCGNAKCLRTLVITRGDNGTLYLITFDDKTPHMSFLMGMIDPSGEELFSAKYIAPIKDQGSYSVRVLNYVKGLER